MDFKAPSTRRIERLKSGYWQFGCAGSHIGSGAPGCPRTRHHHHDEFCRQPLPMELHIAGVDPKDYAANKQSRA